MVRELTVLRAAHHSLLALVCFRTCGYPSNEARLWDTSRQGRCRELLLVSNRSFHWPTLMAWLGAVFGGFIAEYSTWRWVFWATAACTGLVRIVGIFVLREDIRSSALSKEDRSSSQVENRRRHSTGVTETTACSISCQSAQAANISSFHSASHPSTSAILALGLWHLLPCPFPNVSSASTTERRRSEG